MFTIFILEKGESLFKAIKKAIFQLEDISISKNMSVVEFKNSFFDTFGTHIRVYQSLNTGKGSQIATDEMVLNDLKGENKTFKEIFIKKTHTVGEIEDQFKEQVGIGIQVMLTNGVEFAPNEAVITDVKEITAKEIKDIDGLLISGRMKVDTLKKVFKKEFGLSIRIYDGISFADDKATLASIRKGDAVGGEFNPKRNMKIGNVEQKIEELFGIKVQISGSDDSYLCENEITLAGAIEEDRKKIQRKQAKQ